MPDAMERALQTALASGSCQIGEIAIRLSSGGYVLTHRADGGRNDLRIFTSAQEAIRITKFDDVGEYRPLKTAPNLCHGWQLEVTTLDELRHALDHFYPGRLAAWAAWKGGQLKATALRQTLSRQSGMYRVAANVSDEQIDEVVGNICRSDGGCLRTILWKRDAAFAPPSTKLPSEKFDPDHDQAALNTRSAAAPMIPLLCQEACNLLVAECRDFVKTGRAFFRNGHD